MRIRDKIDNILNKDDKYLIRSIKELYSIGDDRIKTFIRRWIDGIVIDKEEGSYLDVTFDESNLLRIVDEDIDKIVSLKSLQQSEKNCLYIYLRELVLDLSKIVRDKND